MSDEHHYSICRALQLYGDGRALDGLEGEVHQELTRRSGKPARGFYMPMGDEPEYRDTRGIGRPILESRGTTVDTTAGAGALFVVPSMTFIDLLRAKLAIARLGGTFLTGIRGKFAIPRQTAGATAAWTTEGSNVTAVNQTIDNVTFVDRTLAAMTNVSRKFIFQSSPSADGLVRADLAAQVAVAVDAAAIAGTGVDPVPLGLTANATIATNSAGVQGGTNGAAVTWDQVLGQELQVGLASADIGSLGYLTTPAGRRKLKATAKVTGYPGFIMEGNRINGYPAEATKNVPSTLTKGTSSGVCSALIFGNFADLVVASFGPLDVVVDPYSGQASGNVRISTFLEADVQVAHPESFSIIYDFVTT